MNYHTHRNKIKNLFEQEAEPSGLSLQMKPETDDYTTYTPNPSPTLRQRFNSIVNSPTYKNMESKANDMTFGNVGRAVKYLGKFAGNAAGQAGGAVFNAGKTYAKGSTDIDDSVKKEMERILANDEKNEVISPTQQTEINPEQSTGYVGKAKDYIDSKVKEYVKDAVIDSIKN